MANYLFLASLFFFFSTVFSQANPSDIFALKSFKSLISPSSIPHSTCLESWDFTNSPNPCEHITKFICAIECDSSNRVTHITLDPAGYSGLLSPYLSRITSLISLDLSDNNFYGPIPSSLSSLRSLQNLVLKSNKFSGQIPSSIMSLASLETIDLSLNSLSGSLPDFTSPNLKRLDISFNKITGKISKLPPNLLELALKGNQLTGELVKSSFAESTQLEVVELGVNSLTGTVPKWFFLLRSLQQVNLANNSFTRVDVPKPTDSNLVAVDLGFNKIMGTIPENLLSFPILSALTLRYNNLRGPIPSRMGKKGSFLKRLYLDGNFLNGVPPVGLFSDISSISGSLGDNCLAKCPGSSELCVKSQKPSWLCRKAYTKKPIT